MTKKFKEICLCFVCHKAFWAEWDNPARTPSFCEECIDTDIATEMIRIVNGEENRK